MKLGSKITIQTKKKWFPCETKKWTWNEMSKRKTALNKAIETIAIYHNVNMFIICNNNTQKSFINQNKYDNRARTNAIIQ